MCVTIILHWHKFKLDENNVTHEQASFKTDNTDNVRNEPYLTSGIVRIKNLEKWVFLSSINIFLENTFFLDHSTGWKGHVTCTSCVCRICTAVDALSKRWFQPIVTHKRENRAVEKKKKRLAWA